MPEANRKPLAELTLVERCNFIIAEWFAGPFKPFSMIWNRVVMLPFIWFCGGRRYRVNGLEHLADLTPDDRVVIVSNHRSFFDLFVIMWAAHTRANLSRRVFFPVRARFFYSHILGGVVNLFLAGMSMFPPFSRDRSKMEFNRLALERLVKELELSGTLVGIHPEGTRNKTDDPFAFLPAQPGVGKLALVSSMATVVPVFIMGMSNDLLKETIRNWTAPNDWPIEVRFGPPIDLGDLREKGTRLTIQKRAADRCMDSIRALATKYREEQDENASVPQQVEGSSS